MFTTLKLKLDTFNSANIGKMTEIGHDVCCSYQRYKDIV
jgi:hypothetical protein